MTTEPPLLYKQDIGDLIDNLQSELESCNWKGQEGGAGKALVHIFGRLTELVATRLNQVPDKYFLAFLNEAGVDLLAPRPASADLTFTPAEDGPSSINVPEGTQVATVQTETQAEVIFETQRDLTVAPNTLVKCVAFDPLNARDCTAEATGEVSDSFAIFQGEEERERILYLGDETLFTFDDDASRQAAEITLTFEFDSPGNPTRDGWKLEWLYWDGSAWTSLPAGCVSDETSGFSKNGNVKLSKLPALTETEVGGVSDLWIACQLTGGSARDYLPVLRRITGSRSITITASQTAADSVGFGATQANTAFLPFDLAGDFFPLGQRPSRLDTLYLMSNEAFSKQGATVEITMASLIGVSASATSSELDNLKIMWEYCSSQGWVELGTSTKSGVTTQRLTFDDKSYAFTTNGTITFKVPQDGGSDPIFEETTVNDEQGLWIRARVVDGSYNVPAEVEVIDKETGSYRLHDAQNYAPLVKQLEIAYSGYTLPSGSPASITHCRSSVDGMDRDHSSALADAGQTQTVAAADGKTPAPSRPKQTFAPFSAADEGPALYLGFQKAFPAQRWVQFLLDVDEETSEAAPDAFWEYWNGSQWTALRASDGSLGFSERGYLGFFGPDDHEESTEFDQSAYWLRTRPHHPPVADAGDYKDAITTADDEAAVTLDASASTATDRQTIKQYIWRSVSSDHLQASIGGAEERQVTATGGEATVQLDASGSVAGKGEIVQYIWRAVEPEPKEEKAETTLEVPYLKAVRFNTVPAVNAVTVSEEVLGSGDGKPDQIFTLLRTPVLPNPQIAVREPDRPPAEELEQLEEELQEVEEDAEALLSEIVAGEGVWVRWCQVSDFYRSDPHSRHFTLDPVTGQVRFGDGERGRILPVGNNNVKAVLYGTHGGASGNVQAGVITVLRNPSGDLANIKSVTNPEAAAGGSAEESVDEVKQRGPQSLKHRQRAVAIEDFVWLALEASGEIAQARCLPTCDSVGLSKVGWVTVVITPESTDARPTPTPALLRYVQSYLEDHALANLKTVNHIYVKGPEYIEVTVLVKMVPSAPEETDEVKLAVLEQLETFLHPLKGGPERTGWQLGRDVYLSEVCAEIEAVSGVDHVVSVRLLGSLQQYRLQLQRGNFRVGDQMAIVMADDSIVVRDLLVASVAGSSITFGRPFAPPANWDRRDALMSTDGRLRLSLAEDGVTMDTAGRVTGMTVETGYRRSPFDVPVGSQVSTFDDQIRLLLAEPVRSEEEGKRRDLKRLVVYGFKEGDEVDIVAADDTPLVSKLTITSISTASGANKITDAITFDRPFSLPTNWSERDAVVSTDGRLRLLLATDGATTDSAGDVTGVTVYGFEAGDKVSLVVDGQHHPTLEFLPIEAVELSEDRIFVPADHLVCSGGHDVEMVLE